MPYMCKSCIYQELGLQKNLRAQHPLYQGRNKVDQKVHFSGSFLSTNSLQLVDQSSTDLSHRTQDDLSRLIFFPILDILSRSGDIRDQNWRKFCMFLPPQLLGRSAPPPNFWTCIIKFSQFPIMWQSFTAIGRRSSEIWWRIKKTSRAK